MNIEGVAGVTRIRVCVCVCVCVCRVGIYIDVCRRHGRCYLYTNIYICMYIHTRHTLTHRCMQEAWQVLCVYIHILLCIYMHDTNTHTMTHRCIFGGVAGALCIHTRTCMY